MEYNSDFGYDLAVGQMSEKALGTGKDIRGGDNNTSKGVLLPLNALIRGNEF